MGDPCPFLVECYEASNSNIAGFKNSFIHAHKERERENSNSNSKTLFSKDCSLGSFRPVSQLVLASPLSERERERERRKKVPFLGSIMTLFTLTDFRAMHWEGDRRVLSLDSDHNVSAL